MERLLRERAGMRHAGELVHLCGTSGLGNDLECEHAMLTYQRYEGWLDKEWLRDTLNLNVSDKELKSLSKMDAPENFDRLKWVGEAVAECTRKGPHSPARFDLEA